MTSSRAFSFLSYSSSSLPFIQQVTLTPISYLPLIQYLKVLAIVLSKSSWSLSAFLHLHHCPTGPKDHHFQPGPIQDGVSSFTLTKALHWGYWEILTRSQRPPLASAHLPPQPHLSSWAPGASVPEAHHRSGPLSTDTFAWPFPIAWNSLLSPCCQVTFSLTFPTGSIHSLQIHF